jgi:hypothetical protein
MVTAKSFQELSWRQQPINAAQVVASLLVASAYAAVLAFPSHLENCEDDCRTALHVFLWCNYLSLALSLSVLLILLQAAFWQGQFDDGGLHPEFLRKCGVLANLCLLAATALLVGAAIALHFVFFKENKFDTLPMLIVGAGVVFVVLFYYSCMASGYDGGIGMEWLVFFGTGIVVIVVAVCVVHL